jgi:CHAT domain-containing protein/tetratricopeptide (TPR) repeat protein
MIALRLTVAVALLCTACTRRPTEDHAALLREADGLAWLTNWTAATPVFARAETLARDAGDERNALYAKFGRLRGEMQVRPLPDVSAEIARDLDTDLAKSDRWLTLRGLTAKGDVDLEWDVPAARDSWQQVLELAAALKHEGWMNRARGDLGMIAFLQGDSRQAGAMVAQSLQAAAKSGDVGGQLRYFGAIGAGLLLAGDPRAALGYVDKALAVAQQNPDVGFPYPAYSTKILALVAVDRPDEAQQLVDLALKQASTDTRRIKQVELLMMAATIARKRGHEDQSLSRIERAVQIAKAGGVQRLLGDAEAERSSIYRNRGDLTRALDSARTAVRATKAAGSRWELPQQLQVQAASEAALGKTADAERTYEEALDILEGTMLNVPSGSAQARLVGVMSDVYTGHFALAARQGNAAKAFSVLERARGRALADLMRGGIGAAPVNDPQRDRVISRLQVRLLRASSPAERRGLLSELWDTEQRVGADSASRPSATSIKQMDLPTVQQRLAEGEVLLAFVLMDPKSYCLVIDRGSARLVELAPASALNAAADRFISELHAGRPDAARRDLASGLISPLGIAPDVNKVIVVPDGQLHRIPFDMLLAADRDAAPTVTAAPSATVFALLRQRSQAARQGPPRKVLLAVGGVPYGAAIADAQVSRASGGSRGLYDAERPAKLAAIPASRTEVQTAARMLNGEHLVLTGAQANESNLKAQPLADYGVLHFAVHAFADAEFPARAALVLLGDQQSGDDGLIQPREIGSWRLNATLVVLSACDTSVGPTIGQEGVQNLARAFIGAGARAVITTLWTVNDRVSLALMRSFYAELAAGRPLASALASAKTAVIRQLGPPAIPTVAAFQIVGDGDATLTIPEAGLASSRPLAINSRP